MQGGQCLQGKHTAYLYSRLTTRLKDRGSVNILGAAICHRCTAGKEEAPRSIAKLSYAPRSWHFDGAADMSWVGTSSRGLRVLPAERQAMASLRSAR